MSRAFVKEDTEIPERSTRKRSASGLPPGAVNYLTARGAARMREKIAQLESGGETVAAGELAGTLASATVVGPPDEAPEVVTFGATVTLRTAAGAEERVRIVGVDEVGFEAGGISWVSPEGRGLLGAARGETRTLGEGQPPVTVVQIEHPAT